VRQFKKSGVIGVLAAILGLNFAVGLLLWLIERKSNSQQFGGKTAQGIGSAIWCAITTMMTVGYGDKVPVTWAGRLLCFVVMLTGVVIISIFTATAGSAMTVARLETEVNSAADLRNVTCVALNHSTGGDYIRANGLRGIFVRSLDEAFDKLMRGEAAVLIHDRIRVESALKKEARGAVVLPTNLKEDYFAFTLPMNSSLKPTVDTAIEEALDSDAWTHAQTNTLGQ
jgi:ABC-type amino acid transport substrate-binding protein